jgi:hypothetical protein
MNIFQEDMDED